MKTRYIVPLLLFCLFACMACEDDKTEMPRLFRPSFIASSCFAEDNTITLAWRTSGEATSYTVELSQDATFQSEKLETQTVEYGKCTFTNLRYETKFYARVRANNESLAITSNWTEMGSSISTLSRVVPKILHTPQAEEIGENSVEIRWVVSEQNPVDGVVVWQEGTMEEQHFTLDDATSGSYTITGLSPRTAYCVALTNSAAPEGAEKYNQRRFTTGGMPAGAVLVEDGPDLVSKIEASMADDTKSELIFQLKNGVDYYLSTSGKPGENTKNINVTKNIALLANPGERPTIYIRKAGFVVQCEIDYFMIDNVNIEETIPEGGATAGSSSSLLTIKQGDVDFVIDRFEITNSDIFLPTPTVLMWNIKNATKVATINHIRVDNCLVRGSLDTNKAKAEYGFVHALNAGCNVWKDISITNCTFYERYVSPGILGAPTSAATITSDNKVLVSNCTFYNWDTKESANPVIGDFSKLTTPLNLSINNCIFSSSNGPVVKLGDSKVNDKGNYCTVDFEKAEDAGLTLVSLDASSEELYKNVEEFDFTIMDTESVVYQAEYGDPRWIKVFE